MVLAVFEALYGTSRCQEAGDVTFCCLGFQADFLCRFKIIAP